MNNANSKLNIIGALVKVQSEIRNPANTATNPFFKSKYAPLSEILNLVRPLLSKNGLVVFQDAGCAENGGIYTKTTLYHTSGESIESDKLVLKPEKDTPQKIGSVITYGRRYQLSSMLGISSEDDNDGNATEKDKPSNKTKNGKTKATVVKPKPEMKREPNDDKAEKPQMQEVRGQGKPVLEKNLVEIFKLSKDLKNKFEPVQEQGEEVPVMILLRETEKLLDTDKISMEEFRQIKKLAGIK